MKNGHSRQRHVYRGDTLRAVAMPLGGLGTGTIALAGDGSLRQWQINNQINHQATVPHSFFAVWARQAQSGAAPVARVLQSAALYDTPGPSTPPTTNDHLVPPPHHALLQAVPGLEAIEFIGEYPIAELAYADGALPVSVRLEAFNPFVPLDERESALPAIYFNFIVTNPGDTAVEASLLASLQNFVGWDGLSTIEDTHNEGYGGNQNRLVQRDGLTAIEMTNTRLPADDEHYGSLALAALTPEADGRPQWNDLQELWQAFAATGAPGAATEDGPSADGDTWNGALAVPFTLQPGESRTVTFVLAWHFPNRCFDYNIEHYRVLLGAKESRDKYRVGNQYNHWFGSAIEVAAYAQAHHLRLASLTRLARDTFYSTTLPHPLIDAVTSQMSVARSPTCFWTEDGRFFGFEGCSGASTGRWKSGGSCPLNCTHVWNYEMALARLFPALERTMRDTEWNLQQHPDGFLPHRVRLPLDLPRAGEHDLVGPDRAALDGLLGGILKTYREYRAGGDAAWLAQMWPGIKRALAHLWAVHDPARSGVIAGEQPNTYDISIYGPNTFIGTLYLAALRAAEEMAHIVGGESELAETCRAVYERGRAALDSQLWNGEYYIQSVDLDQYPKHNWGLGCHADQLLGQWWAYQLGLGELLPLEHLRSAAAAIERHNFRRGFADHVQKPRVYVTDDDHGLLICTWPNGGRPEVPTNYSDEIWTGIEYEVAALLLQLGQPEPALRIVQAARARYDGHKQNPWNDIECGDHYARAMSAWSLLEAASGFDYDAGTDSLAFAPSLNPENYQAPFVTRDGWGTYAQSMSGGVGAVTLHLAHGDLILRTLRLRLGSGRATLVLDGQPVAAATTSSDDTFTAVFDPPIAILAGQTLAVTLGA